MNRTAIVVALILSLLTASHQSATAMGSGKRPVSTDYKIESWRMGEEGADEGIRKFIVDNSPQWEFDHLETVCSMLGKCNYVVLKQPVQIPEVNVLVVNVDREDKTPWVTVGDKVKSLVGWNIVKIVQIQAATISSVLIIAKAR